MTTNDHDLTSNDLFWPFNAYLLQYNLLSYYYMFTYVHDANIKIQNGSLVHYKGDLTSLILFLSV